MHNNHDNQISNVVKANHNYVYTKQPNQPCTSKSTDYSNRKLLKDIFETVAQPIMLQIKQMHPELIRHQPPVGYTWEVRVEQVPTCNKLRCHNDPNNLNNHSHPNLRMQNNTYPKPTRGNTNNASNNNKITKTFDKKDMEVIQILAELKQTIRNKLKAEQNNKITPKSKPKTVINLIDEERTNNNINSFQHLSTINKHQKKTQTHPTTKKESQKFSILNITTSNNGYSNITKKLHPSNITSKYTTQPFINNTKVNPSLQHSTTSNKSIANAQLLPMTIYRNSDDNNSKLNTTSGKAINKNQPKYKYPYPPYTSNSPFKCPTCNKKFQFNSNLKKHMDIHLREKPHQCQTCLKSFNTKILFKKHHHNCKNMSNHDRNHDFRRHTTK